MGDVGGVDEMGGLGETGGGEIEGVHNVGGVWSVRATDRGMPGWYHAASRRSSLGLFTSATIDLIITQ